MSIVETSLQYTEELHKNAAETTSKFNKVVSQLQSSRGPAEQR